MCWTLKTGECFAYKQTCDFRNKQRFKITFRNNKAAFAAQNKNKTEAAFLYNATHVWHVCFD